MGFWGSIGYSRNMSVCFRFTSFVSRNPPGEREDNNGASHSVDSFCCFLLGECRGFLLSFKFYDFVVPPRDIYLAIQQFVMSFLTLVPVVPRAHSGLPFIRRGIYHTVSVSILYYFLIFIFFHFFYILDPRQHNPCSPLLPFRLYFFPFSCS